MTTDLFRHLRETDDVIPLWTVAALWVVTFLLVVDPYGVVSTFLGALA